MNKRNTLLLTLFILTAILITSCKRVNRQTGNENQAELEFEIPSRLGEGAFWNHRTAELYWVDIEGRKFHIYNPETGLNRTYNTPSRPGTVVAAPDSTAVLALEDGIYELNLNSQDYQLITAIEEDITTNRFNDGKCDPNGNLWVGSMRLDETIPDAHLYRVSPDGNYQKMLSGITISNGIAWSRDAKTMYYIDTPTGMIRAFDFDLSTSSISNERVAVVVDPEDGFPDGMTIDEDNNLWVGLWNGNAVACYDPQSGKLVRKITVPAHNVTACAFGGKDLDILYITTASVDMTAEEQNNYPQAGSIFSVKPGVKGVRSPFFGK